MPAAAAAAAAKQKPVEYWLEESYEAHAALSPRGRQSTRIESRVTLALHVEMPTLEAKKLFGHVQPTVSPHKPGKRLGRTHTCSTQEITRALQLSANNQKLPETFDDADKVVKSRTQAQHAALRRPIEKKTKKPFKNKARRRKKPRPKSKHASMHTCDKGTNTKSDVGFHAKPKSRKDVSVQCTIAVPTQSSDHESPKQASCITTQSTSTTPVTSPSTTKELEQVRIRCRVLERKLLETEARLRRSEDKYIRLQRHYEGEYYPSEGVAKATQTETFHRENLVEMCLNNYKAEQEIASQSILALQNSPVVSPLLSKFSGGFLPTPIVTPQHSPSVHSPFAQTTPRFRLPIV